jgi:hypothetical protein
MILGYGFFGNEFLKSTSSGIADIKIELSNAIFDELTIREKISLFTGYPTLNVQRNDELETGETVDGLVFE